jgi:DNA-binding PadR family transcriptional regulator
MSEVSFKKEQPLVRKKHQLVVLLWLMRGGPIYGYELAGRFQKLTKGHIKMSYGIIYPFLRRMESRGLVVSNRHGSTGRVYYVLTPKGKLTLKQLLSRLQESKRDFDEELLGFLAIYSELFGQKALRGLLSQVQLR